MPSTALVGPEQIALAHDHLATAVGGEDHEFEVTIRHKSGRPVQLLVTNIPIVVAGAVVGVYGVARDFSLPRRLLDLTQPISATSSVEGQVNLILSALVDVLPYDSGGLYWVDHGQRCCGLKTLVAANWVSSELDASKCRSTAASAGLSRAIGPRGVAQPRRARPAQRVPGRRSRCLRAPGGRPGGGRRTDRGHLLRGPPFGSAVFTTRVRDRAVVYRPCRRGDRKDAPPRTDTRLGGALSPSSAARPLDQPAESGPALRSFGAGDYLRPLRTTRAARALLLLDLDRFKEVNDTLGHHAGRSTPRRRSGLRLRGTLRESDTVARLGGDEFAAVLPGADAASAVIAAANSRRRSRCRCPWKATNCRWPRASAWPPIPRTPRTPTHCCVAPTSPCIPPSALRAGSPRTSRTTTAAARNAWRWSVRCGGRSPGGAQLALSAPPWTAPPAPGRGGAGALAAPERGSFGPINSCRLSPSSPA